MDRMRFETASGAETNAAAIARLFPNCVTEGTDEDGNVRRKINFEMLKQMLSEDIIESRECYEFTWPGKKKAIAEANRPARMTLRPDTGRSVNWETTNNLYIEGDNLMVLKVMQESYLGRIKMIYIDPPYNTGSDLIYRDDFAVKDSAYKEAIGLYSEERLKLYKNTESNGRFHSDWCSMIYPRLMLARNLLTDDGVIFISIDDHEQANLTEICDEIFGRGNCIGQIIRKTKSMTGDNGCGFNLQHETLLVYAKDAGKAVLHGEEKAYDGYSNPDGDPNGDWCAGDPSARSGGPSTYFEIENPYTHRKDVPPAGRYWAFSRESLDRYIRQGKVKFKESYRDKERGFIFKRYRKDSASSSDPVHSLFGTENQYMNQAATAEIKKLFGDNVFSYPKPTAFIKKLVQYATDRDSIILDFFSGSAVTAQAVMEQNAADGGHRKFIMVQLPEPADVSGKAGGGRFKTLCDVGRERIRLAAGTLGEDVDKGFRTLYLDDTNMNEVYYRPGDYSQDMLNMLESSIKPDRSGMDLLYGCLLEWGLPLNLPLASETMDGCTIYTCNGRDLTACFDADIPDSVIRAMAERRPLRAVFCDRSFADSCSKINVREIFKLLSPDTRVKVL